MSSRLAGNEMKLAEFRCPEGVTLVEASAGTGKTFTIQFIVLDLILQGMDAEEILVVTYTVAATRELNQRIRVFLQQVGDVISGDLPAGEPLGSLLERATGELGRDVVENRIRKVLSRIDRLPVFTIHGFCQNLLQAYPVRTGAGIDWEVVTDTRKLIRSVLLDYWRGKDYRPGVPFPSGFNLAVLESRAHELKKFRKMAQGSAVDPRCLEAQVEAVYQVIRGPDSALDSLSSYFQRLKKGLNAKSYRPDFFENLPAHVDSLQKGICPEAVFEKFTLGKLRASLKKGFKDLSVEHPFIAACSELKVLQPEWEKALLKEFDTYFVENYRRRKELLSWVDFDDLISILGEALQGEDVLREVRKRYRAVVVDEFQDTNRAQTKIFERLFGCEGHRWVMVGDPKQAIYGFRGGDVEAYLSARDGAGTLYSLETNYRSEPAVIRSLNEIFSGVDFGSDSTMGRIQGKPVRPADWTEREQIHFSGGLESPGIFLWSLEAGNHSRWDPSTAGRVTRESVLHGLIEFVECVRERKIILQEGNGRTGRSLNPGDVALLVGKHAEGDWYADQLLRRGIPCVRSKVGSIYSSDECIQFLYFLRACISGRISDLRILLISPLVGLSLEELKKSKDAELNRYLEFFVESKRRWERGSSIGKIWYDFTEQFGIQQRLLEFVDGERRMTNFHQLVELCGQLENERKLSGRAVVQELLELREAAVESEDAERTELIRSETDSEAIRITTLHSSKGLQYRVVFLGALWMRGIPRAKGLRAVSDPHHAERLLRLDSADGSSIEGEKAEILRLGYVGLTRAIHLCVMPFSNHPLELGSSSHLKQGTFMQWLEGRRKDAGRDPLQGRDFIEFLKQVKGGGALEVEDRGPLRPLVERRFSREFPQDYGITSFTGLVRRHISLPEPVFIGEESPRGGVDDEGVDPAGSAESGQQLHLPSFPPGKLTGSCLHAILEEIDYSNPAAWDPSFRTNLEKWYPWMEQDSRGSLQQQLHSCFGILMRQKISVPDGHSFTLGEIGNLRRFNELEFHFPVLNVRSEQLFKALSDWGRHTGSPIQLQSMDTRSLRGFLNGSVDLLLESGEKFFIVDWKTNRDLRDFPGMESYRGDGLHAQMVHGNYYLQALVYSVACRRYLIQRIGPGADRQLAGFAYVFLRGIGPDSGCCAGRFDDRTIQLTEKALGVPALAWGEDS